MAHPVGIPANRLTLETPQNEMTVEKIRDYLFHGPQVPFWNYDPQLITVGLEIEYFIGRVSPHAGYTLATHDEYFAFIDHLQKHAGYRDFNLPDQPGRVSRDTPWGFIAVKPDFAWHILEMSLPPRRDLADLKSLMEDVFAEVDRSLHAVGLVRLDMSALPNIPEKMDLVQFERLAGSEECLVQEDGSDLTVFSKFPALIAATHIHINAANEQDLALLPMLFQLDPYVSEKFTRKTTFRGQIFTDLRKELYSKNFGEDYYLHTIPKDVPDSLEKICDLMNRSRPIFPNDRFFPVRNMSFVRPSRHGTFEFRSSCSFLAIETLLDLTRWRIAQLITASNLTQTRDLRDSTIRRHLEALHSQNRPAK